MRYAVVDIGSNTVKIYVYDAVKGDSGLKLTQIMCESRTLGLINYVKKGQMSEDGILKLVQTLIDYKRISDNISTDVFICFATAFAVTELSSAALLKLPFSATLINITS